MVVSRRVMVGCGWMMLGEVLEACLFIASDHQAIDSRFDNVM